MIQLVRKWEVVHISHWYRISNGFQNASRNSLDLSTSLHKESSPIDYERYLANRETILAAFRYIYARPWMTPSSTQESVNRDLYHFSAVSYFYK